ncbi:hypothetical protein B0I35DRAFT_484286 [Stachybotrys elegans]|uniref:Rhodopsin domain-containing protein n=1 Tax=Stachybotrys elegans TaxID=80388 RepID=A0A8K0WK21_9HYPO|nr:hypothetical protein B0I35DRAFT_484286 [Stachybotrys elegans]
MQPLNNDTNICVAISLAFATVFTACRFWARYLTQVKLWWDDFFAGLAYLIAVIWSVVIITWTFVGGLGQEIHTLDMSPHEAIRRSKIFVILAELCYAFSLVFSKYAILGMYWRLFSTSSIRLPIQILLGASTVWIIIRTFMTIFHCVPPQAFWDDTIENAQCNINNSDFFFGTTLTHLLIDVAILVLPVMQVKQLKLRTGQKIGVIGLFMFGAVVCVASIVLIVAASGLNNRSTELPYDMTTIMIPATVEIDFAIVSACLPMMRPVIRYTFPGSVLASDDHSSNTRGHTKTGGARTGNSIRLRSLTPAIELDDDVSTKVFADRNYAPSSSTTADVEMGGYGPSRSEQLISGPTTVIEVTAGNNASTTNHEEPEEGGIRVMNETRISYENKRHR